MAKIKLALPYILKAYIAYSVVSETVVLGGLIYLIFF